MRRIALAVALFLLIPAAGRPLAWGAPGHRIVSLIAMAHLTEDARRGVAALLGAEDLVIVSTWADEVRGDRPETANWHFVNIPVGETRYDAGRDCAPSPRGDCIVAAIARTREAAVNAALPIEARREALKFLVHFVGDLHQPLHTIANADRGGNDVRVQGEAGRTTSLHSVWDSGVIQRRALNDATYSRLLLDGLAARPIAAADRAVDVVRWIEGAHRVAVDVTYAYPEFTAGAPPAAAITLGDAYLTRAETAIDRQLQLGGVRLAALLNEMFGR